MTGPAAAGHVRVRDWLKRPIFIISTPRSGSTLLFETLAHAPNLYTVGGESHALIEQFWALGPAAHGWASNRLTASDASVAQIEQLSAAFYRELRDREGRRATGPARMLEKTPKNALRIPFLHAAWPNATFIYLYRDARQTLSSMIEAWHSGRFSTYPRLPGWRGLPWSLLLTPGWQALNGQPLANIVAHQWATTTEILIEDLATLAPGHVRAIAYDDFLAAPQATVMALLAALDVGWDRLLGDQLPLSTYTVSKPRPEKWRDHADLIASVWPIVEEADAKARAFAARLS